MQKEAGMEARNGAEHKIRGLVSQTPSMSTSSSTMARGGERFIGRSSISLFWDSNHYEDHREENTRQPTNHTQRAQLNSLLVQCESIPWPLKKTLVLDNMQLCAADIPVTRLCRNQLGNTLQKLSLAKNPLSSIPPELVQCLPALKSLDLSQCQLDDLPDSWSLD